ncbi:TPA: hypothetical protein ACSIR4_001181 [Acinetobacter baumannii]|nr:hypothetical protein [Acinetobacter baumannii]NDW80557.1 hypothetical protein [Acinetobacter baumannii]NDW95692.1 hypothetical protein [Acinetobacter baumannii]
MLKPFPISLPAFSAAAPGFLATSIADLPAFTVTPVAISLTVTAILS